MESTTSQLTWDIVPTSELENYGDAILQMYHDTYATLGVIDFGGFLGMAKYYTCSAYCLNDSSQIMAIILYWMSDYGNKIGLVNSANNEIAKNYTIPKLVELINTPGFYVELSDALEHLVR